MTNRRIQRLEEFATVAGRVDHVLTLFSASPVATAVSGTPAFRIALVVFTWRGT